MIEIKDLLSRFNHILLSEEAKKETTRKIIEEAIRVEIKKEDLKVKNGTIYLNIKPIYKNEILIKQEYILLELEKAFGVRAPKDLR
jgi:hypothetical protein